MTCDAERRDVRPHAERGHERRPADSRTSGRATSSSPTLFCRATWFIAGARVSIPVSPWRRPTPLRGRSRRGPGRREASFVHRRRRAPTGRADAFGTTRKDSLPCAEDGGRAGFAVRRVFSLASHRAALYLSGTDCINTIPGALRLGYRNTVRRESSARGCLDTDILPYPKSRQ